MDDLRQRRQVDPASILVARRSIEELRLGGGDLSPRHDPKVTLETAITLNGAFRREPVDPARQELAPWLGARWSGGSVDQNPRDI